MAAPDAFLRALHEKGIYTIARIVVFKDDPLALGRPDLAVRAHDGSIWHDRENLAWTDPFRHEVWDYNVALAVEAAGHGFDATPTRPTACPPRSGPSRNGLSLTANVLDVEHLAVEFGRTVVLREVTFSVPRGSSLAIIGPNGSGKTVLFKALIGAIAYHGQVRWAPGTKIGYVPQKLDIERDLPLTGLELLRAKAAVTCVEPAAITHAIELVGLSPDIAGKPIGTLSGGQFQRLLLAFALMGRPSVLLFDEPTAGMDEPGEEGIYATIRRLQSEQDLTLLFISHELSLVYRYATNVLCLSRGASHLGPPLEVLTPERLQELYGTPLGFHLHTGAS